MAKRNRYLFVCVNSRADGTPKGSCATRGSVEVYTALKLRLKAEGLANTEARTCSCSCLDACWVGPVIAVEPDHYFYGRVALDDIDDIVTGLKSGKPVERLLLAPQDFEEPRVLRNSQALSETPAAQNDKLTTE